MKILSLTTRGFRNIEQGTVNFSDGINLLYGDNAEGKTNTLEAVCLFANGKSFRTRNERDFIRHGEEFAMASINFERNMAYSDQKETVEMAVMYMQSGQKVSRGMQIDGDNVDRVSDFIGNFRAVLFTPDHLELIKGAPEGRRNLVDMALCQIKPRYVHTLNDYARVLAQRTNYLKNAKFSGKIVDKDYLDVLSSQLARTGSVIIRQRGLYTEALSLLAGEKYAALTGGKEGLFAKYITRVGSDFGDENAIFERLLALYRSGADHDIELGKTSHGPHHDEIMIYLENDSRCDTVSNNNEINDENASFYAARTFGSQGQQRSAVLALKLAEGEVIRQKCGEYPVFLFDDLFSELDDGRKKRLSSMFSDKQCIITSCDSSVMGKGDMNIITVNKGVFS